MVRCTTAELTKLRWHVVAKYSQQVFIQSSDSRNASAKVQQAVKFCHLLSTNQITSDRYEPK